MLYLLSFLFSLFLTQATLWTYQGEIHKLQKYAAWIIYLWTRLGHMSKQEAPALTSCLLCENKWPFVSCALYEIVPIKDASSLTAIPHSCKEKRMKRRPITDIREEVWIRNAADDVCGSDISRMTNLFTILKFPKKLVHNGEPNRWEWVTHTAETTVFWDLCGWFPIQLALPSRWSSRALCVCVCVCAPLQGWKPLTADGLRLNENYYRSHSVIFVFFAECVLIRPHWFYSAVFGPSASSLIIISVISKRALLQALAVLTLFRSSWVCCCCRFSIHPSSGTLLIGYYNSRKVQAAVCTVFIHLLDYNAHSHLE